MRTGWIMSGGLKRAKSLGKNAENMVDMDSNVLYYPVDETFPGVDFIFKHKKAGICDSSYLFRRAC